MWAGLLGFCRKKPLGAAGGVIMVVIAFTAVFANQLQTYDPIATDAAATLAPPSAAHWLGTDHLGRDIYSRILHGARVSLLVGLGSTLVASVLGGVIGLLSGYVGGKTDLVVQRVMDILQGLPLLVLALVMSAALGPSIPNVILAISIPIMPRAARVIRSSVLSIREFQYVEAAHALGLTHLRVAFRHILPNTVGPFIVLGTAQLGSAILVEAALSFLGLGVPEPYPSWAACCPCRPPSTRRRRRTSCSSRASPSAWRCSDRISWVTRYATPWTRASAAPDPTRRGGR